MTYLYIVIKTYTDMKNLIYLFILSFFLFSCEKPAENLGATVSDVDGNVYKTRDFGTQTWMVENLRTTRFNDGTAIPLVEDQSIWNNLTTPAYCFYDNDKTNKSLYGGLYNGYTISFNNLCPTGWHLPDECEWSRLINYIGGLDSASIKLMEGDGFSAILGGMRGTEFLWEGEKGTFQSSTSKFENSINYVWVFTTYGYQKRGDAGGIGITDGSSVRCIKDNYSVDDGAK